MMQPMPRFRVLRAATIALCIGLLAAPSLADIKSFNAAVKAGDFKAAAAEAVATWPTLNKTRKDLPIIAREFGFAAYRGDDFAATRMFAEAAVAAGQAEPEDLQLASEILMRLAELKLSPTSSTRDKIHAAIEKRMAMPDVDLIAYYAADAITAYDFARDAWPEAAASAAIGSNIAAQAGPVLAVQRQRFDLHRAVAAFMDKREQQPFHDLDELAGRVIAGINAAPDDDSAKPYVDMYWDVSAWRASIASELRRADKLSQSEADKKRDRGSQTPNDRATRLLGFQEEDAACQLNFKMVERLRYPSSAVRQGFIGTVYLQLDIDEWGRASNAKILAATPEEEFGKAVMRVVDGIRYTRGKNWGPECVMARKGRVMTFSFTIP